MEVRPVLRGERRDEVEWKAKVVLRKKTTVDIYSN
jgi:hypothetical protein